MGRVTAVAVAALAVLTVAAVPAGRDLQATADGGDHEGSTYEAPYAEGTSGGDPYNLIHAGDDGRMVVVRAYPIVSVLSCSAKGGFTTYRVTHRAATPVTAVRVQFAEAAVDPYTFIVINVKDADGGFLGSLHRHGPLGGDGTLEVPVTWPDGASVPRDVHIDFGLQLTSACPSADAGTVRFASVSVVE